MKREKAKLVRRKYDEDFKLQTLKIIENGEPVRSTAQHPGISEGLLHKWKSHKSQNGSVLEKEILLLKAKLEQTTTEHNIVLPWMAASRASLNFCAIPQVPPNGYFKD